MMNGAGRCSDGVFLYILLSTFVLVQTGGREVEAVESEVAGLLGWRRAGSASAQ